jgi:hypothetical protein
LVDGKWDRQETLVKSWVYRAQQYLQYSQELPTTLGSEDRFWHRFTFAPECRLFVAESHAAAAHPAVREGVVEVWNFDAHHDAGYERAPEGAFANENWLMAYNDAVRKYVRYPAWKRSAFVEEPTTLVAVERQFDDGASIPQSFDRVFVCRSSQWVPPWLDEGFAAFVASCPVSPAQDWTLEDRTPLQRRVKAALAAPRRPESVK